MGQGLHGRDAQVKRRAGEVEQRRRIAFFNAPIVPSRTTASRLWQRGGLKTLEPYLELANKFGTWPQQGAGQTLLADMGYPAGGTG